MLYTQIRNDTNSNNNNFNDAFRYWLAQVCNTNINNSNANCGNNLFQQHPRERTTSNNSTLSFYSKTSNSFDVISNTNQSLSSLTNTTVVPNSDATFGINSEMDNNSNIIWTPPKLCANINGNTAESKMEMEPSKVFNDATNCGSSTPFSAHFNQLNRLPMEYWLASNNKSKSLDEIILKNKNDASKIIEESKEEVTAVSSSDGGHHDDYCEMEETNSEQLLASLFAQIDLMKDGLAKIELNARKISQNITDNRQKGIKRGEQPYVLRKGKCSNDNAQKTALDVIATPSAYPPLNLPSNPAFWLKKYPQPKVNRPMNEMAKDLSSWESVLGWKKILENIHSSGEEIWLAPSSRRAFMNKPY